MKNLMLILLCVTSALLLAVPTVSARIHTPVSAEGAHLDFRGHFRINYYADSRSDEDDFGDNNVSAARWRFMPTFDYYFGDDLMLHVQLRIGQFHESKYNNRWRFNDSGSDPAFDLRQGYVNAKLSDQVTGTAGIIPMSDKFGDTLFSSDWDFAPLGLVFSGSVNDIGYRIGTGKLYEGDESSRDDDVDIYLLDVDYQKYGASAFYLKENTEIDQDTDLFVYGVRGGHDIGNVNISGFLLGSTYSKDNSAVGGTDDKSATGYAAKVAVNIPIDKINIGVMGIYTSGDKDFADDNEDSASSFITPQSVYHGAGAWGYTGKMNVQWPMDTGVDDPINIDGGNYANNRNLGLGISTIQAKITFPIINTVDGYLGAGYFTLNDAPDGRDEKLGTDIYAQVHWNIIKDLHLFSGIDYANLEEGHHNSSTASGDQSRDITTFFSQLVMAW